MQLGSRVPQRDLNVMLVKLRPLQQRLHFASELGAGILNGAKEIGHFESFQGIVFHVQSGSMKRVFNLVRIST